MAPTGCETELDPGEDTTCTGTYKLGQDDVNKGVVTNAAHATGNSPEGQQIGSHTATVSSGPDANGGTGAPRGSISAALEAVDSLVENATLGTPVSFIVTITNTGPVTLKDPAVTMVGLSQGSGPGQYEVDCSAITSLNPGVAGTCDVTYHLSNNDLKVGKVSLSADALMKSTLGYATALADSGSAFVTFEIPGGLAVSGTVALKSGQPYAAGSTVNYTFTVKNTGATSLADICIDPTGFTGTDTEPTIECPETTLDIDGEMECTATYTLTQDDVDNVYTSSPGSLDMHATATAHTGDPNNPMSQIVHAGPLVELLAGQPKVAMTASATTDPTTMTPEQFKAGATVKFTFDLSNNGAVRINGLDIDISHFSGSGTLGDLTCTPSVKSLSPSDSTTCTASYTLTQADVDAGGVSVGMSASGTYGDDKDTGAGATTGISVVPLGDVNLVKTVNLAQGSNFAAGSVLQYSFVVTNVGNATLTDIELKETAFSGKGTTPNIVCTEGSVDTLAPGASVTCTAKYKLLQADVEALEVSNTAEVSATYYDGKKTATNEDSARYAGVASNGISIVQKVSTLDNPLPGQELQFTYTVTNTGSLTLTDWKVTQTDFDGTGTPPEIDCPSEPAELAPGGSVECTGTYAITDDDLGEGSVTSTVAVSADSAEGTVTDSSTIVSMFQASGGISLVKTAALAQGGIFEAGSEVTFTFKLTNTGTLNIAGATISENEFTGTGPMDMTACDVPDPFLWESTYSCDVTYVLTQEDINNEGVTNTAGVSGTFTHNGSPVDVSDSSTISLMGKPATSITLEKTVDTIAEGDFKAGSEITYNFDVTNTGATTLQSIVVSEEAFSGSGTMSDISCDGDGPIDPKESIHCEAQYQVTQEDVDAQTLSNKAKVQAETSVGQVAVNDESTVTLSPSGIVSSIAITDEANPTEGSKLTEGSPVKFTLVVTNNGETTLQKVAVTSYVRPGTISGGKARTLVPSGQEVSADCGTVPAQFQPGDSFTCTVPYKITAADLAAGAVTNIGVAAGVNGVDMTVDATASAEITDLHAPAKPTEPGKPASGLSATGASTWMAILALVLLSAGALLVVVRKRS